MYAASPLPPAPRAVAHTHSKTQTTGQRPSHAPTCSPYSEAAFDGVTIEARKTMPPVPSPILSLISYLSIKL